MEQTYTEKAPGTSLSAVDVGLLVLRVGIGIVFILHGYPKIAGGPEVWGAIGGAMTNLGIDFAPVFWGFMAALAEFGGGILLIFGLFTRIASILLTITMIVATVKLHADGVNFSTLAHPLKMAVVFLALTFSGPGRLSLRQAASGLRNRWYC